MQVTTGVHDGAGHQGHGQTTHLARHKFFWVYTINYTINELRHLLQGIAKA